MFSINFCVAHDVRLDKVEQRNFFRTIRLIHVDLKFGETTNWNRQFICFLSGKGRGDKFAVVNLIAQQSVIKSYLVS